MKHFKNSFSGKQVHHNSLLEAPIGPMLDPEMLFSVNFYDSYVIYRLGK